MVHYRINESEPNPNPHINFITALPMPDPAAQEQARQLLRALAAQVKPVMKAHGFVVNSLEEYEFNPVFAGRNWNQGEVVELVLREAHGGFSSISWLMSTLCHELAHIKHPNHSPAFYTFWRQLNGEVRALQAKGYFGDGYWSSGTRLVDSARVAGDGVATGALPEFMCGGAQTKAKPTRRRRRRQPTAGPSRSGAQSVKRRKAGSRVTADVFKGDGRALNADIEGEEKKAGTGFRKQATSKRAREERALATERRLRALQGKAASPEPKVEDTSDDESDGDEEVKETDLDRRKTMLDSVGQSDFDGLKSGTLADFWGNFILPEASKTMASSARPKKTNNADPSPPRTTARQVKLEEITSSLGVTADPHTPSSPRSGADNTRLSSGAQQTRTQGIAVTRQVGNLRQRQESNPKWSCLVCTLENEAEHLACSACATPRGESAWTGS
ncbi:WLM-domain-containing protein [Dentipellis sp. KUC8613]|nr:WLM-domain-containing protein [Dentipellis sp. KUC8613]